MEQQIQFCTTSDGVSIAYATLGDGPPVVYVTGWPGHLGVEWEKSVSREFLQDLAQGVTLIRYDMRGSGLSEHEVSGLSLAAFVRDLEAVVDQLALKRFALLSLGFLAGPISITYAADHPDRVSRLVLSSAYLRGSDLTTPERARAIVDYIRTSGFPFDMSLIDDENASQYRDVARIQKEAASRELQAKVAEAVLAADVSQLAPRVTLPALVLHGREDSVVPFSQGRALASRLPNAQFVPFEGNASAPWQHAAFIAKEVRQFLGVRAQARDASTARVHTILFTDIEGSTTLTQRLGDARAQELLRAHNAIVRESLAACGGVEIKHTGDGIMASFTTASRALECAIAIQRSVEARHGQTDAPDVWRVRIGLNAGEPVAEERDLFGTAVQLARRICDHAEAGQVLASDVVRQLAAGKGFFFADIGQVMPKGFDEAVRLFEVRWREGG